MGKRARSSEAIGWSPDDNKHDNEHENKHDIERPVSGSDARVAADLQDAWRLAYVVVADGELATKAVSKAVVGAPDDTRLSRVELLESTLRISLTRAADSSDTDADSAVTMALWRLPAEQRAALWLTTVTELDDSTLGAVLGLTTANAGHIAERAVEWLDVALDHESGPLCEWETELADFADDRLAPEEAKELEEHLPECPTCRTKLRARDELADLKSVLDRAVPTPPAWLATEALGQQESTNGGNGDVGLDIVERTPAVRPLAACCAALLIVAIVGIAIIRSGGHGSDPVTTKDPPTQLPSLSGSAGTDGVLSPSATAPETTATTLPVTTSSLPVLTFPTVPGGRTKR